MSRNAEQWRTAHHLGGCLVALLERFGAGVTLARVERPERGRKTPIELIEQFARELPQALAMPAQLVYELVYEEGYPFGSRSGHHTGDRVATIWSIGHEGRRELYRVSLALFAQPNTPSSSASPGAWERPKSDVAWSIERAVPTRSRWQQWARALFAEIEAWAVLDTETTSKRRDEAEIIEVAATDLAGNVLVNTLVRPPSAIPPDATAKNGITDAMVASSPPFADVYVQQLQPILGARKLLTYNAEYDVAVLQHNIARSCGMPWQPLGHECLMQAYAHYCGVVRWQTLERACQQMGIPQDQAHRALGDCLASLDLLRAMAR